jgi:hypothetical protein
MVELEDANDERTPGERARHATGGRSDRMRRTRRTPVGAVIGAGLIALAAANGCGQNGAEGTGWTRVEPGNGSPAATIDLAGVKADAVTVTYYYMPG